MAKAKTDSVVEVLSISPPRFAWLEVTLVGTAPLVQARFPEKARTQMAIKMEAGSTGNKGKKRDARNFEDDFRQSMYLGPKGEHGINASAFRAAAISACRIVGFKMTLAKLGLFIEADMVDPRDGTPLVKVEGKPEMHVGPVRNANGAADLRARAMWKEWSVRLRVRFDSEMFKAEDVLNLLARIGGQVGIGEGRADSKKSAGCGWGFFTLKDEGKVTAA